MFITAHSKLYLSVLCCLLIIPLGRSQERSDNTQLWIDYYPSFYMGDKLQFAGDTGYRTIINDGSFHLIYGRPSVRYYLNETFEIAGGIGFFYEINRVVSDRFEIRPWQGLRIYWPKFNKVKLKRFRMDHYFRIEERISFLTQNKWAGSFDLRGRYRLSVNLKLCVECTDPKWFIPAFGELFVSLNKVEEVFRDRGRAGVGLDYKPKKGWKYGIMFNWQGSRTGQAEDIDINEFIIQFKIKHHFDEKPSFFEF